MKKCICDRNWSFWWKLVNVKNHHGDENSWLWWKLIVVLKFSTAIWPHPYGEYFSPWKLKTTIKIHHCDENRSIWWKFIIMMKIHNCDAIWLWLKWSKSWKFMIEKKIQYGKCYLLGRSWCNPNMMKNYGLNKNPSLWGKFMLSNLDVRSTLQTNELCFVKFSCIWPNFTL